MTARDKGGPLAPGHTSVQNNTGQAINVRSDVTPERLAREAQHALFAKEPDGRYELNVTAKADGSSKARVQIYGVIGDWWDGLDAATLASQISALDVGEIEVHLNSPGGSAWDGLAIRNALAQHAADVHVIVDGLAASAASIISTGGTQVTMSTGSQMMIHDASGACYGQASDMAKTAEVLASLSDSMADVYAERAGGSREDWRALMLAETWYTASEAVTAGLADQVSTQARDDKGSAASATAAFDLSIFAYAGRDSAPAPHMPPARPAEPTTQKEGVAVSDTLIKGLREQLGVTAELDEAGLLAALAEALAEQAEPAPTASLPESVVAIDRTQLEALQADAQQGRAARQEQLSAAREALVTAAVNDGRVALSSVQDWRNALEQDDQNGTATSRAILASLPTNKIPVTPVGYTGGVNEADSEEDEIYAKAWGNPSEKKEG